MSAYLPLPTATNMTQIMISKHGLDYTCSDGSINIDCDCNFEEEEKEKKNYLKKKF